MGINVAQRLLSRMMNALQETYARPGPALSLRDTYPLPNGGLHHLSPFLCACDKDERTMMTPQYTGAIHRSKPCVDVQVIGARRGEKRRVIVRLIGRVHRGSSSWLWCSPQQQLHHSSRACLRLATRVTKNKLQKARRESQHDESTAACDG